MWIMSRKTQPVPLAPIGWRCFVAKLRSMRPSGLHCLVTGVPRIPWDVRHKKSTVHETSCSDLPRIWPCLASRLVRSNLRSCCWLRAHRWLTDPVTDDASIPALVYRRSSAPDPPLTDEARETLVASPVREERAQVALEPDLSHDLIARLILDEDEEIRQMVYNVHGDIPATLLEAALANHPEDAPHMAFQMEAPLAALRVKSFNFATLTDIERYLQATTTDPELAQRFRSIPKTSINAMVTLDELMGSIRPK